MIIGSPAEDERMIRFTTEIHCNDCGRKVPGGLKTGEVYYHTKEFTEELDMFKESYLCGICRDRARTESSMRSQAPSGGS